MENKIIFNVPNTTTAAQTYLKQQKSTRVNQIHAP